MRELLCAVIQIFTIALLARVILSWFPVRPGSSMYGIVGVLNRVTEPVLAPLRRVLPSTGMLDLSPMILFLVLSLVSSRFRCSSIF